MIKFFTRLGATLAVLAVSALALVVPANADTGKAPAATRGQEAAAASGDVTQALVVGGLAFVLMVAAAGGVLWFTARKRHHEPH
ncbi:hypothetical protein [Amycolatopsis sp. CA-230715]|uniref:hypothetical protein n=1 Tax=Amycolatopsis sp. CA-230715 TaxID=2745196 RepID=UPI001C33DA45|nr:hypothetical protein [Amycolatopsis sp. CA-230715]QWF82180.1 hypothetical protein HUW46_05617 [Amycolatopsis sp. CA-230715]